MRRKMLGKQSKQPGRTSVHTPSTREGGVQRYKIRGKGAETNSPPKKRGDCSVTYTPLGTSKAAAASHRKMTQANDRRRAASHYSAMEARHEVTPTTTTAAVAPTTTAAPSSSTPQCGFVALVGAPNVGKSTLLNALVGTWVSIVTPKAQTTRTTLQGLAYEGSAQLILVDTPGIFEPKKSLDQAMMYAAWKQVEDADCCVLMIDAQKSIRETDRLLLRKLLQRTKKVICVLNKIDCIDKRLLLSSVAIIKEENIDSCVFMISALKGDGIQDLKSYLASCMPLSPWLYPQDATTNCSLPFLISEITREKIYYELHQEIPYTITVEVESFKKMASGDLSVHQVIYVPKESIRKIVLGKGGEKIRNIRQKSEHSIEKRLGCKVSLHLFVKIERNWAQCPQHLMAIGLEKPPSAAHRRA